MLILILSVLFCFFVFSLLAWNFSDALLDVLVAQSDDERAVLSDTSIYQTKARDAHNSMFSSKEILSETMVDDEVLITVFYDVGVLAGWRSLEERKSTSINAYLSINPTVTRLIYASKSEDGTLKELSVIATWKDEDIPRWAFDIIHGSATQVICGKYVHIRDVVASTNYKGIYDVYYVTDKGTFVRRYTGWTDPVDFEISESKFQYWHQRLKEYVECYHQRPDFWYYVKQQEPKVLYTPHIIYYAVVRLAILAPPVLVFIGMDIASIVRRRKKRIEETYW